MNQILKLTILLTICCVVRGQCNGLTVYDDVKGELNISTVCIRKYATSDCQPFYQSFDQSLLPEGFPKSNESVERPLSVTVKGSDTPLKINTLDYIYPGFSIHWRPPFSGISRSSCFGYLVSWHLQNGSLIRCQLFHIKSQPDSTLRFQYNISTVSQRADYIVRVYSMPPNDPLLKDNDNSFVQTQIATPAAYRTGNPNEWSPFVGHDIFNNGTIQVSVSLAPAAFNITEFKIYLKTNGSDDPLETFPYSSQIRTEKITEFTFSMTVRNSGFYYVVVWALDMFPMKPGLCQCWAWINNKRTCKNTCGGTKTNLFYVNITNPPSFVPATDPAAPTATFDSTVSSSSSTNPNFKPVEPSDQLALIIGLVVAAVALLALGIICFCLFRNKSKVKHLMEHWRRRSPPEFITTYEDSPPGSPFQSGAIPDLSKKTIYLVSADDHEAHVRLTEALAKFLEVHCHCRVILPSHRNLYEIGAFQWFISSITKSDFIMFVNSQGAQKMIEAYLNETSYTSRKVGPDGDLFMLSLKHIFNDDVREKSLILVSFHGKHCQKYLQIPHVFKLPKHLCYLLQKIHQLDSSVVSSYSKVLPLNVENIEKLPEGLRLISASKYVKTYEENNPQWFENNFGNLRDPKPLCGRGVSVDSGCSVSYPLLSISRQGSFSESPSSVLEHVTYPSAPTGDKPVEVLSCYTIKEVREQMDERMQESYLVPNSLIPPESASEIIYDSHSTAMSAINKNNYDSDDDDDDDEDCFQETIIPPQNPLDIQLDSVSSAIAEINTNTDKLLLRGDNFLLEDEGVGSLSHCDSVSV